MKDSAWLKSVLPADLETCNASSSFLQSGFWGSFKARFGWNARSFRVQWNDSGTEDSSAPEPPGSKTEEIYPLLVIRRRLVPGISFSYVPWGPELPADFPPDQEIRNRALAELAESLKVFLPRSTAFIRFDPPWYTEGPDTPPPGLGPPFIRSGADIQAPDTVLINLEEPLDLILKRMKTKWRYNSRLAHKRGVIIRRRDEEGLDTFYTLLKETSRRDGISIHSIEYYKTLFSHCRQYQEKAGVSPCAIPMIHLYTAEHEGEALAAIIVLFRGREATYLYGASSGRKRNLMAPYALQVRAMEEAKDAGCLEYDLFGIPPNEDPDHPMAGLYRFKTGFGGRIIHRPGSWDYPCRPIIMKLFGFMESLRKALRDIKKKISSRKHGSGE